MSESEVTECAHCGRICGDFAGGYAAVPGPNKTQLQVCHPNMPDRPDCYRLVTVYHEELGSRMGEAEHLALFYFTREEVAALLGCIDSGLVQVHAILDVSRAQLVRDINSKRGVMLNSLRTALSEASYNPTRERA